MDLLTTASAKITHSNEFDDSYLTAVLYLTAGGKLCPYASGGCLIACLETAGRMAMVNATLARQRRTELLANDKPEFLRQLTKDIAAHVRKAKRVGATPCVRLNGTSDVAWEYVLPEIFARFPDVIFYDYTKAPPNKRNRRPDNYQSLTFSRSEKPGSDADAIKYLENGGNAAVVFSTKRGQPLPETWKGFPVIDGDKHDLRFLDPAGTVVGLRGKGQASKDTSGFVINVAAA
jgi:hypothetical protein